MATTTNHDGDRIEQALNSFFGHPSFRSKEQEAAIRAIVEEEDCERDVFVSMPTGSGKSLVYQLPGVLLPKGRITIVVSPLIALIKDQLEALQKKKIHAESLNSKMGEQERKRVLRDIHAKCPDTRFLYVTPEQCATNTFKSILEKLVKFNVLGYFVIDEAHCVSQWGHDFRPDYLKLGQLRKIINKTRVLALTATASKEVAADVFKQLKMKKEPLVFKVPCFRSNLFYDVVFKESIQYEYEDLKGFVLECLGEGVLKKSTLGKNAPCGIIYCRTRDGTLQIASQLTKRGIPTLAYHGGLKDSERSRVQESWADGKVPVIAATISFGMGVDKATVRFVAHWSVPQTIAGYYQESGRAGRDGKPSFCRIYHSREEKGAIAFLLQQGSNKAKSERRKEVAKSAIKSFEKMVKYCEGLTCRHFVFSRHFNDDCKPDCDKRCDVCVSLKTVEKKVEAFHSNSLRNNNFRSAPEAKANSNELYGGGREGNKRHFESYDSDGGDSGHDYEIAEKRAKKDREILIKKEFRNRKKGKSSGKDDSKEDEAIRFAKVKGAEFTKNKIAGLEVRARESYLGLLETNIRLNYDTAIKYGALKEEEKKLSNQDILQIAVNEEYQIFTSNKVVTMYRRGMAFLMAAVKKDTDGWNAHSCVIKYDPSENNHQSLSKLASGIKKEEKKKSSETTSGNVPKIISKGGFKIKRDPLTQVGITNYFSKSEPKVQSKWKSLGLDDDEDNDQTNNQGDEEIEENPSTSSSNINFYNEANNDDKKSFSSESPISYKAAPSESSKVSSPIEEEKEEEVTEEATFIEREKSACYEDSANQTVEDFKERLEKEYSNFEEDYTTINNIQSSSRRDSPKSDVVNPETFSKLEETISKLQKQIAESEDSINYELLNHSNQEEGSPFKLDQNEIETLSPEASNKKSSNSGSSSSMSSRKHRPKIKVKVEDITKTKKERRGPSSSRTSSESSSKNADKKSKKDAANEIVKVLVPHYKSGKIMSKEVFKFAARELTHVLLDAKVKSSSYGNYVSKFFKRHCSIVSIDDARTKINHFKSKIIV
uniref:ATP-dependent DNA helicase Q5 n=2 Tax=Lepeophtheirus salmonis TaxID=72036 RepID=A0A0K2SV55_LEPSM